MSLIARPDSSESAPYYAKYIEQVGDGDIRTVLETQAADVPAKLRAISDADSLRRYEPGKWSIREVVAHMNDTERVFAFRAFWFARGFDAPMPSFDQDIAAASAGADDRPWGSLIEELQLVRAATVGLFRSLPPDAWDRRGVASDNPVTVRALAYIAAGHVAHHVRILEERYLRVLGF